MQITITMSAVWDAVLGERAFLFVQPGSVPRGILTCQGGVFLKRGSAVVQLQNAEWLASRLAAYPNIVVVEADESVYRCTKVPHRHAAQPAGDAHARTKSPTASTRPG